jgi:hypothetical protein
MNPKQTQHLISLKHHTHGLASHYQWEKEILVDYIARRIGDFEEDILEDAKYDGITHEDHYRELCLIAKALRKHAAAGLQAKIQLEGVFFDLRDFVEWGKEELADYLIHQIVLLDLSSVFENNQGNKRGVDEISSLAFAVYFEQSHDGCSDAEIEARELKKLRDYHREQDAAREAAAAKAAADEAAKKAERAGRAQIPIRATAASLKSLRKAKRAAA